jgi:hypothetical protein
MLSFVPDKFLGSAANKLLEDQVESDLHHLGFVKISLNEEVPATDPPNPRLEYQFNKEIQDNLLLRMRAVPGTSYFFGVRTSPDHERKRYVPKQNPSIISEVHDHISDIPRPERFLLKNVREGSRPLTGLVAFPINVRNPSCPSIREPSTTSLASLFFHKIRQFFVCEVEGFLRVLNMEHETSLALDRSVPPERWGAKLVQGLEVVPDFKRLDEGALDIVQDAKHILSFPQREQTHDVNNAFLVLVVPLVTVTFRPNSCDDEHFIAPEDKDNFERAEFTVPQKKQLEHSNYWEPRPPPFEHPSPFNWFSMITLNRGVWKPLWSATKNELSGLPIMARELEVCEQPPIRWVTFKDSDTPAKRAKLDPVWQRKFFFICRVGRVRVNNAHYIFHKHVRDLFGRHMPDEQRELEILSKRENDPLSETSKGWLSYSGIMPY